MCIRDRGNSVGTRVRWLQASYNDAVSRVELIEELRKELQKD